MRKKTTSNGEKFIQGISCYTDHQGDLYIVRNSTESRSALAVLESGFPLLSNGTLGLGSPRSRT
jgi:hypothetical protein